MCETFMIQRTAVVGMNMIVRAETAVCCVLNVLYIYNVGYTLHHYLIEREIAHYFERSTCPLIPGIDPV